MSKFINGDCLEAMKEYPDNYFDLSIVDPPYGLDVYANGTMGAGVLAKQSTYKKTEWDKSPPNQAYFNELIRVSKNQIIWGANHFISKIPFDSSCWIVWNKKNGENNFADCELAYTSFKTAVRMFEYRWQGMLQENMKNKEFRIHPTQKPIVLYKWLLKNYAKEGEIILDTHVGSASSLIACEDMGFEYVGYEIDEDYYKAASKRLDTFKSQIRMF